MNNYRELAESKLIILYIIDKVNAPITNIKITNMILDLKLMNYFSMQEYISELIDSKFIKSIEIDSKIAYIISDEGKKMLTYFNNKIPYGIKKRLDDSLGLIVDAIKEENSIFTNYREIDVNSFNVSLKIIEKNVPLFNLDLIVGTKKDAKQFCENFKQNSDTIYQKIIMELTK